MHLKDLLYNQIFRFRLFEPRVAAQYNSATLFFSLTPSPFLRRRSEVIVDVGKIPNDVS